ncbi:hypothetical protein [Pedobacter chitinilyticus]|uniref:BZIP transcription factor n=1 Tax=Pedobacter chitinilyticus TaxID=2233776 RepID=A0A443Z0B6_9SPHI|nr:hypothetical protein [Pedobacter chitinilyticus]RWU09972.1 hypothetical protein DPV69_01095 [Pedobacter chitinilyticus]
MKRITTFLLVSLCANAMAQETLQTVTDRGNSAQNSITIGSGPVNSNTSKIFLRNNFGRTWALSSGANMINENDFSIWNWTNDSTTPKLLISDAGNVGIGLVSPLAKLHVNGLIRGTSNQADDHSGLFESLSSLGYGLYSRGGGGTVDRYSFSFNNYNGVPIMFADGSGNVGIGTNTPSTGLQLGNLGNNIAAKQISIPGNYNFEVLKLGQIGNGNAALEIVNHAGVDVSYGVKIKADIDHGGPGLQLQYAPTANDYSSLQYQTGLFLSAANGDIGIGTTTPQEKLSVNGKIRAKEIKVEATGWPNGKIRAKEIKVEATGWPDYVFKADYKLNTLPELEAYIKANGHLPGVPAATEVEKEGVALGEMNKILLKKIEELTLHLIEKDKKIEETNKKLDKVMQMVEILTQKNK